MHEELKQVVADWKNGKPVRVLALGHSPTFRQPLAYECAFRVIDIFLEREATMPKSFAVLAGVVVEVGAELHMSEEEQNGATSLAWAALRRGWASAIANHPDYKYLMLKRMGTTA
jgi:hypothetical protein